MLQIKYVQARDAGVYECQVSTEPKVSAKVHLHVVGMSKFDAKINTGQEMFCTIKQTGGSNLIWVMRQK